MFEKMLSKKGKGKGLMLHLKGYRPLDKKSIAHYAKILVIKGNTMALKMAMSTFLTEKR